MSEKKKFHTNPFRWLSIRKVVKETMKVCFLQFRYGHFEVTELLVKHGASVNACDLWRFTPLHEGAAKGKYEIVKLLLKHGADPTKKNRDGHTAIDLVKEVDQVNANSN